jgi:hypothetical protein
MLRRSKEPRRWNRMFRLSAIDAINPAFERMKAMLFRPFRFKTWLKIGFIGWLAGAGTGSFNLNLPSTPGGGSSGGTASQDAEQTIRAFLNEHLLLIALIVGAGILIGLAFVYISCRFRFILFDSVLQRDPKIGRGWRRYGGESNRYFGFVLCFMVASGVALTLVIGLPLWRAFKSGIFKSDNPFPALLAYLIPALLGAFLFVILAAVIASLANDFAVPLLALDNATIGGAWSMLKQMISIEPGAFAGYLGMKLLLSIAAGIVVTIAMVVVFLVLLIPGAIIAFAAVAIVKGAGTPALIILYSILFLVALALFFFLTMLATAPVVVFFTSYSFYFFGGRYPRLGALLWPQPPPAPVAPAPLVPPPPVPGAAPAV